MLVSGEMSIKRKLYGAEENQREAPVSEAGLK
jgi:hypothetical protein